jgi:YidC/Oxa1 family membrane protein insertase
MADAISSQASLLPMQYGDLANLGLIGWNPAGLARWSLELIQVSTGMPWFWTIVAGTAFWRLFVLPLTIMSSKNTVRLTTNADKLDAAKNRLLEARKTNDANKLNAAVKGMRETYKHIGVSPSLMFVPLFAQMPIAFGVFFGIKGMCELPVEQLTSSGLELLPDLTAITYVADPYCVLPIMGIVAMNIQMKVRGVPFVPPCARLV